MQTTVLGCKPTPMALIVETQCRLMTAKKRCNSLWIVELSILWYVVFNHFFLKLLLFFILLTYFFHDTYNTRLKERHGDDLSIHLDLNSNLWLEKGSSYGPDRNRVNDLPDTMAENFWMTCSVSIIGFSQQILSAQTPKFEASLDQRVKNQTTHFDVDYE